MSAWRWSVGSGSSKVTALELPHRRNGLYLRWRARGNWAVQSLQLTCRTATGRLIKAACEAAQTAARAKSRELAEAAAALPVPGEPVTLAQAEALAFHPDRGRWTRETANGKELARALALAAEHWGPRRRWHELTRADWRSLWRWRLRALQAAGHRGYRGSELLVQHVATVADWLVEEGHVLRVQGPERKWREQLAADYLRAMDALPEAHRPRHTLDEMRRILEAAQHGDPRFALLMALGAELRLGQVVRCRRSDLDLERGTLRVRGRGTKGGTTVQLTGGQLVAVINALHGYLHRLEGLSPVEGMSLEQGSNVCDYPLFPQGPLPGGRKGQGVADPERHMRVNPVNRRWVLAQFRRAEALAGVPHVPGRGAYGVKRAAVDAVKSMGISREGLKAHGGWASTEIPDRIYADGEAVYAREEAARLRARIRGEPEPPA